MILHRITAATTALLLVSCAAGPGELVTSSTPQALEPLPSPVTEGGRSLEEVLASRRSVRSFAPRALTRIEIGQLLWSAQGITSASGARTAPSAGALYPLELYLACVDGVFHYHPREHALDPMSLADVRGALAGAGYNQQALTEAAAIFIITAIPARTESKYGDRADRYVQLEAGHAAQNLLLQAVALDLGAVPIGSFEDAEVASILALPSGAISLYLIPVGEPAD